jgi:superfamily II DNA helicase RecQ
MPMYILHDLYLVNGDLSAQVDYLIITRKRFFVVECKNLIGDIEVNSNGDFIRTLNYNGKYIKEGIYSPITQNKRHLELIKQMRSERKSNIFTKALFEKFFYENYRSIVVLANPKTVVNLKYAKKEVKDQIIRADQLIEYIKKVNNESGAENMSEKDFEQLAQSFLDLNQENQTDYLEKYKINILPKENNSTSKVIQNPINISPTIQEEEKNSLNTNSDVFIALKEYRLKKSREENIKPYFIYNDKQLYELIEKNPQSIEELKSVAGFGDAKCNKYGDDILKILQM